MKAIFLLPLSILTIFGLAGCSDSGRTRPPSTTVTVLNAAAHLPPLDFVRVQRTEATLEFRQGTQLTFDEDQYTFRVKAIAPDTQESVELTSFEAQLSAATKQTFVITEAGGAVTVVRLEQPPFDTQSTNSEYAVLHAGEALPDVDFYLEPPGTDLATVAPKGTLSFLSELAATTIDAGDYVVTLTEPGNSANVLFESSTGTLAAGQSVTFVYSESGGEGTADAYVFVVSEQSRTLADVNQLAALRALNAATDRAPRDLYIGDDFTAPPQLSSLEFGAITDLVPVPPGDTTVSITPIGNPGTVEASHGVSPNVTRIFFTLISGTAGDLSAVTYSDDLRRIDDAATLRLFNAVSYYDAIEIFLLEPGTDITTVAPSELLAASSAAQRRVVAPGDYAVTMRDRNSKTIIAGPEPVTFADRGVYSIISVDNADGSTADLIVVDDSN